jgi:hypothetical protein
MADGDDDGGGREAACVAMKAAFLADEASGRNVPGRYYIYRDGERAGDYATAAEANDAADDDIFPPYHHYRCTLKSGGPYTGPRAAAFFTTPEYRDEIEAQERASHVNARAACADDANGLLSVGGYYIYVNGVRVVDQADAANEAAVEDAALRLLRREHIVSVYKCGGADSPPDEPAVPCLGAQQCAKCNRFALRCEMLRVWNDDALCQRCIYKRFFDV